MKRQFTLVLAMLAVLGVLAVPMAQAIVITNFDEILFETGTSPGGLSAEAEFLLSGNTLTLILRNTSSTSAGAGAGVLLTGIGFNLPDGIWMLSGSADMTGSAAIGFTAPGDGDVSDQWGLANADLAHFQDPGTLGYDAVVSTMTADTGHTNFAGDAKPKISGPGYGLLAENGLPGGQLAIQDSLTFTLDLSDLSGFGSDLLDFIDSNPVAVTFGSPDGCGTSVPDGGATLLLLGLGLLGVGALKRHIAS